MPVFRIGSAGWNYPDWIGPFYPDYVSKERHLSHYAKFFDVVEINSTHYNIPRRTTLKKWINAVPDNFRFCIKVWNKITHTNDYGRGMHNLDIFLNAIKPIEKKTAYILLQFPPSFRKNDNNILYLGEILREINLDLRTAVELRHNSWFEEDTLKSVLNGKNQILTTVYLDDITPYYPNWQDGYYIRVIGNRSLTKFDKVQRQIPRIWDHLTQFVIQQKENTNIVDIFVIFNNHYSGFSPTDSNSLKQLLGIRYKDFTKTKKITDFF